MGLERTKFENDLIDELVSQLAIPDGRHVGPLLINQPRDIFNCERLFNTVLAKPQLKCRQIIWSTGSPNVPTALDAEKIIITTEDRRVKRMEVVCAGDLHEDEIRERLLSEVEGGPVAFARRATLYAI